MAYPDYPNADLLERIPLDAGIVLDVGCGSGALGAAYRRRNPRARLFGIELDPNAAAQARHRLDEVAVADVEATPLPFDIDGTVDCVIYGDVLEHLVKPWSVLRRHTAALSDHATVLICVPNVEHWSFLYHLLGGDWAYQSDGLLDAAHLRWFSLDSMHRVLLEVGLTPCDVHPRLFETDQARSFVAAMEPSLRAMRIDPQEYANRASPLQYIWRACKHPRTRLTVAATMLEPIGGVSHVRIVHPLQAMSTDPSVLTRIVGAGELPTVDPQQPRVCVLHRPILTGRNGREMLQALLSDGWLIVTEFDDHPDFFRALRESDQLTFRGAHAVQTTTPALAEVLRTRNPEIMIFPNMIRELPDPTNFMDPPHLTVFFGALNRERDWEPLVSTINDVADIAGDRLRFQVVHDRGFFNALKTPHKAFTPLCNYDTYIDLLAGCEICFMPLSDTVFNRAKSDLKFVEAGACRTTALASNIVYGDIVEDGVTGLVFHSPDELRDRFLRLLAMPDLARSLADAAREYVANSRMLAYQAATRIAWYRSLWARRRELTTALHARIG